MSLAIYSADKVEKRGKNISGDDKSSNTHFLAGVGDWEPLVDRLPAELLDLSHGLLTSGEPVLVGAVVVSDPPW